MQPDELINIHDVLRDLLFNNENDWPESKRFITYLIIRRYIEIHGPDKSIEPPIGIIDYKVK